MIFLFCFFFVDNLGFSTKIALVLPNGSNSGHSRVAKHRRGRIRRHGNFGIICLYIFRNIFPFFLEGMAIFIPLKKHIWTF